MKIHMDLVLEDKGNIYIADIVTHRFLIVDTKDNVTALCGTGYAGAQVEQLNKPAAVFTHDGYL